MYGIHKLGFIDRMEELAYLKGIEKKDFFVLIKGRRRIGKTRITYEAFNDYIYVFIWPDKSVGNSKKGTGRKTEGKRPEVRHNGPAKTFY
jgi:AAA+ ATPase superfamily predicted ATPase